MIGHEKVWEADGAGEVTSDPNGMAGDLLTPCLCRMRGKPRRLQRVAMRMGRMATWSDESLLRRPPQEDRGCHRARHAQGRSAPYVRDRDLHPQALRYQAPKRRAPGALPGSRQTAQDRRASRQAPRRGSEGAPVRHPKGALRVRGGRKWGFGEPL